MCSAHTNRDDEEPPQQQGTGRAVVPMVGKALEAAIVVLFIGTMTTALYGGVVPEYRAAAGDEVADRALVAAAGEIEGAVPPNARSVTAETRVTLPSAIRNANYRIVANGTTIRLEHPDDEIGGTHRLALPRYVRRVEGTWRSGAETTVLAETEDDGVVVRLVNG